MNYISKQQLDTKLVANKRQIKALIEKEVKLEIHKLEPRIVKAIKSINLMILGSYKTIAYVEFQRVFASYYGKNFDINSLNQSLSFYIDNNFVPHVTYDSSILIMNNKFLKNKRLFNQNANQQGSFRNLEEYSELEAVEEMEFFGCSLADESPYEWADDNSTEIENAKVFNRRGYIKPVKEAYEEAEAVTDEVFVSQFNAGLMKAIINACKI